MNEKFDDVEVQTPTTLVKSDERQMATPFAPNSGPISMTPDVARQIAEVHGMIGYAKQFPRNEVEVRSRVRRICERFYFAETAKYAFKRGGQVIAGLGIKSVREIASAYGNLDYGYRETSREEDGTWVEAYALDLQTNVRVVRKFYVKHWRDKREGGSAIEAQRDIYEHISGQAQRKVRSCLEQLLPSDLLNEADYLIDKALEKGPDNTPFRDRLANMLVRFNTIGVTEEMIEGLLQHTVKSIQPSELPRLYQIYSSLKDGNMTIDEIFGFNPKDVPKQVIKKQEAEKVESSKETVTAQKEKKESPPKEKKSIKSQKNEPDVKKEEKSPETPKEEPKNESGFKLDPDGEPDPFARD